MSRIPQLLCDTVTVCRPIHLFGHRLVIHLALQMPPALHLRENPDRHGVPRIGIEVDPARLLLDTPEPVGIGARQDLFEHRDRLIQVIRRSDRGRDFFAMRRIGRIVRRVHNRPEECMKCVRILGRELLRHREGTTGMPVPDLLGKLKNESRVFVDRPLVKGIGGQISIDVTGLQISHHFWRRNHTNLDVLIGMHSSFSQVVTKEIVVHRKIEGDTEPKPFHIGSGLHILVLDMQGNGLPIDVFDGRHVERLRDRSDAHRNRQWHRRQHMCRVDFPVDRPISDHRPPGRSFDRRIQTILLIEPQRFRHDDRCGAGDRNEADAQIFLFRFPAGLFREGDQPSERKHVGDERRQRDGPKLCEQSTPGGIRGMQDRSGYRALDGRIEMMGIGIPRGRRLVPVLYCT